MFVRVIFSMCCGSVEAVESVQKDGKICILDIDVQGAEKVKKSSLKVRTDNIILV